MFSYITRNTHDGEDIEDKFWRSYFVLKRVTLPLAAQPRTEAVAVDVHCLVSLHVVASAGFLVTYMVRMAESYEKVARRVRVRVETVFQGLMRGETGGAER